MRALPLLAAVAMLYPRDGETSSAVLQLLEASGAADGDSLAVGEFCRPEPGCGSEVLLVANRSAGIISVLAGPTPHLNATLSNIVPSQTAGLWLTAAQLDGDRPALLIAREQDKSESLLLEAFVLEPNCSVAKRVAQGTLPTTTLSGLTASTARMLAVAVSKTAVYKIVQCGAHLTATNIVVPPALDDHVWYVAAEGGQLLGTASESLLLVGTNRSGDSVTVLAQIELDNTLTVNRSAALPSYHSATNTLSISAARVAADGLPVIALISGRLAASASRLSLLSPELQPLGTPVTLDANRTWISAVFSSWYGSSSEQQLIVLRQSTPSRFSTSVLVWGAASYLRRRTAAVSDVRGTQEFKTNWTDSGPYLAGISHPLDVEYVKSIWAETHVNTFDYYICAAKGPTVNDYEDFIAILQATANWTVDGRQFRVWLEVAPGSEAVEDGCEVPFDSEETDVNETALFGAAGYNDYAAWGSLTGLLAKQVRTINNAYPVASSHMIYVAATLRRCELA